MENIFSFAALTFDWFDKGNMVFILVYSGFSFLFSSLVFHLGVIALSIFRWIFFAIPYFGFSDFLVVNSCRVAGFVYLFFVRASDTPVVFARCTRLFLYKYIYVYILLRPYAMSLWIHFTFQLTYFFFFHCIYSFQTHPNNILPLLRTRIKKL